MIERHYGQRQIAEGFFNEPVEDWWEPWMKKADEILDDEQLIDTVYEALRRRSSTKRDPRAERDASRDRHSTDGAEARARLELRDTGA